MVKRLIFKTRASLIAKEMHSIRGRSMTKWKCIACGYIYDPEKGDPVSGIKPSTPFEELPDTWVCPVCGVTKDMFEKVE
jgi:rubredoxin